MSAETTAMMARTDCLELLALRETLDQKVSRVRPACQEPKASQEHLGTRVSKVTLVRTDATANQAK